MTAERDIDGSDLRILMIGFAYKPAFVYGGPVRSAAELCEAMLHTGAQVEVATTTANGPSELPVPLGQPCLVDGVPVTYFRRWTKGNSNFSPGLLWNVFRRCKRVNAVHIQSWWNLVSILSASICLLRGRRPVISMHGTLSTYSFTHGQVFIKRMLHRILGRHLLQRSILHTTSDKELAEVRLNAPRARAQVIPNLFSFPRCMAAPGIRATPTIKLLFVGRIHPVKNLELLFEVLEEYKGTTDLELTIVGSGDAGYVEYLKQSYTEGHKARWMGHIDNDDRYEIMAGSDALMLLSHTENFGNVVIEALSQGIAVVVSRNVGASAYVQEHDLGWVVEPQVGSCLGAIEALCNDIEKRRDIRERGPHRVMRDFGSSVLTRKYAELYRSSR